MSLRFGSFTFDAGRRLLTRGTGGVRLTPKAFRLLELLLSRRPDAVSKPEIQETLWPGTFVSETNLPALVNELREALGESAHDATFVRTVHGFGYAFDGRVDDAPVPAPSSEKHVLFWGKVRFDLADGESVMGRGSNVGVWVGHPSVSRRHARISVAGGVATVEDLSSRNGTFVGSTPVKGPTRLEDGCELRLGAAVLVYHRGSVEISTESGSSPRGGSR